MLAKMIDKIVSLKETKTFEINGDTWSDQELHRVPMVRDDIPARRVYSLDALCKMIRTEIDNHLIHCPVFVEARSAKHVVAFTALDGIGGRDDLYIAESPAPEFPLGWRSRENAQIQFRSLLLPNEDRAYLLKMLSVWDDSAQVVTSDNGITQTIATRAGVALTGCQEVRSDLTLQPFRTFLEVRQPSSGFLFRVDKDRGVGLWEADGGIWQLEAKANIAAFLAEQLKDLVEAGTVVVME